MEEINKTSGPARLKSTGAGKKVAVAIALLLALLAAAYLGVCALASGNETMLPNTQVLNIPLGGLDEKAMRDALDKAEARWASQDDLGVFLTAEGDGAASRTVFLPASCAEIDWDTTADKAWQEGSAGSIPFLLRGAHYLKALLAGQDIVPVYGESEALDELLFAQIDLSLGTPVQEHSFAVEEEILRLTCGRPGRGVDKDAVKAEFFQILSEGGAVSSGSNAPSAIIASLTETLPQPFDWNALIDEVCVEPQDAVFVPETGDFHMEVVGVNFNQAMAQNNFNTLSWGESCEIPLVMTEPQVKYTDLEELLFRDLLGQCTTNIGGSANRLSNVKLAAEFCNDLILAPGEEFSYNGTVGRRTTQRGFLPAPAYVGGQTVDEIGGGICQVSSTIYLASLRANMEILERQNHGYTVGYVPNGLDATVYYGSLDFRFRNDSEFPVKILTKVEGRNLTVEIHGTKTSEWTVEMQTEQSATLGYNTIYQINDSVPAGTTKVSVTPYSGCTVNAYRCLYDGDGNLISRTHESVSRYKSRDKVVLVNSADAYQYGLGEAPAVAPPPPSPPRSPPPRLSRSPTRTPPRNPPPNLSRNPSRSRYPPRRRRAPRDARRDVSHASPISTDQV